MPNHIPAPEDGALPRSGRFLHACLAGYLALATAYALVLPLGHAPDEPAHFAYVLFIAEHGRLPNFYADQVGYESYQAPLYYTLSAAVCKLAMVAAQSLGAALRPQFQSICLTPPTRGALPRDRQAPVGTPRSVPPDVRRLARGARL